MMTDHPNAAQVSGYRPLEALLPAHWHADDLTAADGARLHYRRTGAGTGKPPLLLLHGVQVDGTMWLRTALALEADYDVVMPDSRGHGRSARVDVPITHQTLVDDARTVLAALGLERPFVIGHSMGADIAGRLAAVEPVRGVVLVEPALRNITAVLPPMGDTLPAYMLPIMERVQALPALPHAERMVAGLGLMMPGSRVWEEADYVTYLEGQMRFDFAFFRSMPHLGYLFEAPEVLAAITCPCLLLMAPPANVFLPPDAPAIPEGLTALQQGVPHVQVVEIADSGHALPFDQFDRYLEQVRAFLQA